MTKPRLLFVHAHPDDETLTTGATIAHYAALGAEVVVVTCTLGEEGEVIGERWAQLAVDEADQLGGYRIGELTAALAALGVPGPVFLGGAGRWRDSGMADSPTSRGRRFVDADPAETVGALVAIIRDLRPHVVVTYDPTGGYGHPDHIQAHRVTTAAIAAAAESNGDGEPWSVPKFYWAVLAKSAVDRGIAALADVELPQEWLRLGSDEFDFFYRDEDVHAVVEAPDQLAAKAAAMRAHATQMIVEPGGRAFALSNFITFPMTADEHFVLAAGEPGERDHRGWETDLLAGVKLG